MRAELLLYLKNIVNCRNVGDVQNIGTKLNDPFATSLPLYTSLYHSMETVTDVPHSIVFPRKIQLAECKKLFNSQMERIVQEYVISCDFSTSPSSVRTKLDRNPHVAWHSLWTP